MKSVGLDIGTSSVKVVALKGAGRGRKLVCADQIHIPAGVPQNEWEEAVEQAVRELLQKHKLTRDEIHAQIPSHQIFLRKVTLPFTDTDQVKRVLPFEVESYLPVPLPESVLDWKILGTPEGKTEALVCAVSRKDLRSNLDLLRRAGVDPDSLDCDAYLLPRLLAKQGGRRLLIDVGATKTIVTVVSDGRAELTRVFRWGSRNLARSLTKIRKMSVSQAEDMILAGLNGELGAKREEAVDEHRYRLTSEICRTVTLSGNKEPVLEVWLSGGGGRLEGLAEELGDFFQCPARLWPAGKEPDTATLGPEFAVGYGLARRGLDDSFRGVDFRKGEFAGRRGLERVWGGVAVLLTTALVALLSWGGLMVRDLQSARVGADRLSDWEKNVWNAWFPGVEPPRDSDRHWGYDYHRGFREQKEKMEKGFSRTAQVKKPVSALDLLRGFAQAVPPGMPLELHRVSITQDMIQVEGVTESTDWAWKLDEGFRNADRFEPPRGSSIDLKEVEGGVRFILKFNVKEPDAES